MFFYLSKLIWFFLQPSAFCILLIIAGVILTKTRWESFGRLIMKVGAIGVLLVAFSPLGRQLMIPLEDRFPLITFGEQ